ncbi:MAG: TRAP transporter substrate-binding protein [Candidatus Marinimicrobia bacterium]|jgi:C4-dicarboxylate-binding protein DctP|nr:TRAP transporter substrate-binding protein [Candidatus Neomarinimicrobiota bacterium]MBT3630088.1 TRAP transporter substrate-binding protein [Candidatus Neomarinimicrobiota bacterium]MBT3824255.1 TRAP transporter substrate-binding protein [Candidatus Neomarinimicrobiota bacterium]MBT4295463.1 TRAP transporter substrate-binding protein [Candidatus Neomarinimicrobiota bacterium]MBT4418715.1 TRAP transporter substrate-binding protein [Candidatus Neomarinimicrobiota bacterium]
MKTNWIRITLTALIMLFYIACSGKKDTTIVFKYANSQPEQHPRSQSMQFFKQELEKRSQGRIQVENYFSAVLGTEFEVQDMVATGALQGTRGGGFIHANKKYYIFTLPFIVNNWDEALRLVHSDFTKEVNLEARKNGYHIPACGISQGFRAHTNNRRPIQTPDDLKGLKMRVPQQEVYIVNAQALGVNPQELPYSEVYMALKTGVVDGQDNALSNIWDYKIYEVQKYLSLSNYGTGPDPFMVNLDWYNVLSPDLQKLFDEVAVEAMAYSDQLNQENEAIYIQKLTEKLETNTITPENLDKFRKATEPVYQYFIEKGYFSKDDVNRAKTSISD